MSSWLAPGDISDEDLIRALSQLLSGGGGGGGGGPQPRTPAPVTRDVLSSSGDTLTLKSAKLSREPRPGDKVTLKLRDPGVKIIGEEFSFRPRNQFDEDEQRLMDKVKSARQSRKIRNYFLRSEGFF